MRKGTFSIPTGFSVIELLVAVAIIAVISAIAAPLYTDYVERADRAQSLAELMTMDMQLERWQSINFRLPDDLAEAGLGAPTDPWGNPYAYLRIEGAANNVKGQVRKDKNLNPINTDYDLYSMGLDGQTKKPLSPPQSHDDIIRAGNGGFFGLGVDF